MININAKIIIKNISIKIVKDKTYYTDHFSRYIFYRQAILSRYIRQADKKHKIHKNVVVCGEWF